MCYRSVQCIEKVSCRGVFHASVINLVNSKATGNYRVSQVRSVSVQVTNKAFLGSFQKYVAQSVFCAAEQDRGVFVTEILPLL